MSKLVDRLNAAMAEDRVLRIESGDGELYGTILELSERLALIANESDFLSDGYTIVKLKAVKAAHELPDAYNEIYKRERGGARVERSDVALSDWQAALAALMKRGELVCAEVADKGEVGHCFARIEGVNKSSVQLLCFDAKGQFANKPSKVTLTKLRSVAFGTRYLQGYAKYMT